MHLHRLLRRYEPLVIAFAVAFTIIEIVSPLHLASRSALGVTPFSAPKLPPPAISGSGSSLAASVPTAAVDTTAGSEGSFTTIGSGPRTTAGLSRSSTATTTRTTVASGSGAPASPGAVGSAVASPGATVFARPPDPAAGGVAVAGDGSVFATLEGDRAELAHFVAGGDVERVYPLTGVSGVTGLVLASADRALVLSTAPARVTAVDLRTGAVTTFATIPDVAPCVPVVRTQGCDASVVDRAPLPWAAALAADGRLFVADAGQGTIWVVPPGGGTATSWLVDPAFGRVDRSSGPTGLAFDGAGNLVFTVPATSTADSGAVYVQQMAADGSAGDRRTLATFAGGEHPAGLALSQAGNTYLTLPDSGQVAIIDPDGHELRRLVVGADLRAGALTGMAFSGSSVIVAGRPTPASGDTALVELTVGEPGGSLHHLS